MKPSVQVFAILLATVMSPCWTYAAEGGWGTDYDEALVKAKKEAKPVLLDISGSDWCGWCVRLDKEVFSKKEFKDWARKNVVLCLLDFPRAQGLVTAQQRKKNQAVKDRLGAAGFPSVFLLTAKGEVIARTGYRPGGAEKYAAALEGCVKFHEKNAKEIAGLGERPSSEQATRAAALLGTCPEEVRILRRRLAEILFVADVKNLTKKRAQAAYVLVEVNHDRAEAAESFLRDQAKNDPEHYYQRVAMSRAESEFSVVIQAYQGCRGPASRSPVLKAAANAYVSMLDRDLPYVQVKPYRAMMFLQKAVGLACAGRKAQSLAAFTQAKALGAPASMLSRYSKMAGSVK